MAGEDFEFRLVALEEDSRRNQQTHKEFFARFESQGKDYTRVDAQYSSIMSTLSKLERTVEELKDKPAKRWDTVIVAIITAVVGVVVGLVMHGGG